MKDTPMSQPITDPYDPRLNDIQEVQRHASDAERTLTAEQFGNNDIQVDDNALVAEIEGSENIWVQAWVYVRKQ